MYEEHDFVPVGRWKHCGGEDEKYDQCKCKGENDQHVGGWYVYVDTV